MFKFFANLFGYALNFIYEIVKNYGVAIILFTIILKVIMLPISIKQQKTMKKSAKIQVKVKELQEKYKNDQVRMNQEIMDLYKSENMSPFSGCLSSIVQLILVISMFYLVSRPLTYMKHIEPELIDQYTQEIYEQGTDVRYKEIAIIRNKSSEDENVNLNMDFLGLNLCAVPSQDRGDFRVYIIPGLYVITSIISTKLTQNLTKKSDTKDKSGKREKKDKEIIENPKAKELVKKEDDDEEIDMMEEMSKNMTLMMPIMTVSIALIAPLGLALYWLVNNLLMLLERYVVYKVCKEDEE